MTFLRYISLLDAGDEKKQAGEKLIKKIFEIEAFKKF